MFMAKKEKDCCKGKPFRVDYETFDSNGTLKASGFINLTACDPNGALNKAEERLKKEHENFRFQTYDKEEMRLRGRYYGKTR